MSEVQSSSDQSTCTQPADAAKGLDKSPNQVVIKTAILLNGVRVAHSKSLTLSARVEDYVVPEGGGEVDVSHSWFWKALHFKSLRLEQTPHLMILQGAPVGGIFRGDVMLTIEGEGNPNNLLPGPWLYLKGKFNPTEPEIEDAVIAKIDLGSSGLSIDKALVRVLSRILTGE